MGSILLKIIHLNLLIISRIVPKVYTVNAVYVQVRLIIEGSLDSIGVCFGEDQSV
ncbi:MAG: hypothetical protein N2053_02660 [Chitinispirillaceae bacterium]|nr:hypothetical protein [Chitinispirillaceae bacterium]